MTIVNANAFKKAGHTHDHNGKQNIFLSPLAGKMPNKALVMSGTIAEQLGIEVGKNYLLAISEGKPDPKFGRQFSTINMGEISGIDVLTHMDKLGEAVVVDVTKEQPVTAPVAPVAAVADAAPVATAVAELPE